MQVKLKKLVDTATTPRYAKPGDAGMDLVATSREFTDDYVEYGTGLALEIPEGYVGLLFPRSSNSKKDLLLCNSVGVVDSSYRGEVKARFKIVYNNQNGDRPYPILFEVGDACCQLMVTPYPSIEFEEVTELSATERGEGGFGSTTGGL